MADLITTINAAVNNFIWGVPAMICIIGVGLLLSVRTRFIQIRKFPYAIKTTIGRMFRKKDASDGAMTPFQAVCTALAGTVGTGNIAGVAGAIAIGGPGAVFWMWCSAILGMCTKFSGGDPGSPFPGAECGRRSGRRPHVLHQKRSGQEVAVAGHALFAVWRADRLRHRKRHPGEHHHRRHQHAPVELRHCSAAAWFPR